MYFFQHTQQRQSVVYAPAMCVVGDLGTRTVTQARSYTGREHVADRKGGGLHLEPTTTENFDVNWLF